METLKQAQIGTLVAAEADGISVTGEGLSLRWIQEGLGDDLNTLGG